MSVLIVKRGVQGTKGKTGNAAPQSIIVAENIDDVVIVADNIADVNTVADDIDNVNIVADDIANVNIVAGIAANVTTVAGIAANVTAVAGNATNINSVAANATNINNVAANTANIAAVAANEANIDIVAENIDDILDVAALLPDNNYSATTNPTVGDDSADGYAIGSKWLNTVSDEWYICADASVGAAVWVQVSLTIDELGALALKSTINNTDWSGTDLAVTNGGTGASDAATARANLGAQATISGLSITAVTPATDDKVLIQDTSDSNNIKTSTVAQIAALATVTPPTMQVFTASGTWTKPANCKKIKVTVVGGGGAARHTGATPPTAGGTTSFGTHCEANGGSQASQANPATLTQIAGSSGGIATIGTIQANGDNGENTLHSTVAGQGLAGKGGDGYLGRGRGGDGRANTGSGESTAGAGGGGYAITYVDVTSIGSVTVTIGAGGTTSVGNIGTAGICIVEEFY